MKNGRFPWRALRKSSQLFCLFLFLFLFIKTDYAGQDAIPYAVNILFRIDPLLALCASLASRTLIGLMAWSFLVLGLTLIFGRFFCGWLCPMGTLLDGSHRVVKPPAKAAVNLRGVKFYLLAMLLVGALFGLPLAGFFDPFSILVRGLALAVYPAINVLATDFFTFTYNRMPAWINAMTEPGYAFLKATVLPFRQNYFELALFAGAILLSVFLLERFERRFFCKNLCPLGALFAVFSKFSLLRGIGGGGKCGKCRNCRELCRMGAIDEERRISQISCNLCMDCVALCPGNKISFRFASKQQMVPSFSLSRRALLGSMACGATLPFFLKTRALAKQSDPYLVRPPGALSEDEFLGRCVRCGECMKVCIGNALQPTFLAAGIEGMFSPRLAARLGYCEYNCTLCGQVCPTGAIQKLPLAQKQKIKIGHAFFDKDRCLPYAKGIPCMVCEEHCPTPDKAIQFREAEVVNDRGAMVLVRQPYVVDERCIGCGICETKCPLPGMSAVRVSSAGESRNPESALPVTGGFIY